MFAHSRREIESHKPHNWLEGNSLGVEGTAYDVRQDLLGQVGSQPCSWQLTSCARAGGQRPGWKYWKIRGARAGCPFRSFGELYKNPVPRP